MYSVPTLGANAIPSMFGIDIARALGNDNDASIQPQPCETPAK